MINQDDVIDLQIYKQLMNMYFTPSKKEIERELQRAVQLREKESAKIFKLDIKKI